MYYHMSLLMYALILIPETFNYFFSSIGENMHLKLQQEQVKSWRQLKLNAGEEIEHFYP